MFKHLLPPKTQPFRLHRSKQSPHLLAVLNLTLKCTAQAKREADTMQERLEGQAKKGDSTANDLISGGGTGNGTSDVRSITQV